MEESFVAGNESRSADAVPRVPSSEAEVAIRTLASDLEMIGKSGGSVSLPVIQRVAVREEEKHPVGPTGVAVPSVPRPVHGARLTMIVVSVLVIAVVLFALGFYIAPLFG